jgi:hypothetical protein
LIVSQQPIFPQKSIAIAVSRFTAVDLFTAVDRPQKLFFDVVVFKPKLGNPVSSSNRASISLLMTKPLR